MHTVLKPFEKIYLALPVCSRLMSSRGVPGLRARLYWRTDGVLFDAQKIMFFENISKTTLHFFLIVFAPLRRLFKTSFVKKSKKIKIFNFVKKFRTSQFLAIFRHFSISKGIPYWKIKGISFVKYEGISFDRFSFTPNFFSTPIFSPTFFFYPHFLRKGGKSEIREIGNSEIRKVG